MAARVPSRQLGTASRTSRLAMASVSTVVLASGSRPVDTERVVEEGEVEAEIVADQHRAADELEERGEHLADSRRVGDHRFGDAGESGDELRDPLVGTDKGLIGAEQLAAAEPRSGHLGQRSGGRRAAGRLDVEDHEGHLAEGSPEVVEGSL